MESELSCLAGQNPDLEGLTVCGNTINATYSQKGVSEARRGGSRWRTGIRSIGLHLESQLKGYRVGMGEHVE